MEIEEEDNTLKTVKYPMKVDLIPTTDAETEAALVEGSLHCDHGDGVHASLMTTKSALSDNAARATSRKVIELQQLEATTLQELSEEALRQAPNRLEHAARTWTGLSEEQRKVVAAGKGMHELGCTGHSSCLYIAESHKTTEKPVLEENVVRDVAINIIQRSLWRCPRKNKKNILMLKLTAVATGERDNTGPIRFSTQSLLRQM